MNKNKTILLVDDNVDIVEAVQFLLEDAGYKVLTAEKADFLETLDTANLPDLIILDMLLSGKDGREVAKTLKSRNETKHIPIIMISAHPTAKETAKKSGADEFIAKPFDIDYLLEVIETWLKKT
jgi:CheY-like chemotaxis protein